MKSFTFASLVTALLMVSAVHAADSYKWTDDNGQVQYTQLPPKDRPYETIRTRVKDGSNASAEGSAAVTKKATDAATAPTKGELAEAKAEAEKMARNCEIAKQNKEMLQTAAKVRVTDKDGNPRHLTDEERKERMQATDVQIDNYCKK